MVRSGAPPASNLRPSSKPSCRADLPHRLEDDGRQLARTTDGCQGHTVHCGNAVAGELGSAGPNRGRLGLDGNLNPGDERGLGRSSSTVGLQPAPGFIDRLRRWRQRLQPMNSRLNERVVPPDRCNERRQGCFGVLDLEGHVLAQRTQFGEDLVARCVGPGVLQGGSEGSERRCRTLESKSSVFGRLVRGCDICRSDRGASSPAGLELRPQSSGVIVRLLRSNPGLLGRVLRRCKCRLCVVQC